MTAITILHLSDIHIRTAEDAVLAMADKIAGAAFPYGRDADILVIVVSGDIAFSGLSEQYVLAEVFLNQIKSAFTRELGCRVELLIAPGNHDCDFNSGTVTRDILVEQLTGPKPPRVDDSVIESCLVVQAEFRRFRDKLQTQKPLGLDSLWAEHQYDHAGKTMVFDILNVPWLSRLSEESKLYFPIDRYAQREWEPADLRVVIFHHPLNWYSQSVYRPFRTYIRRLANIVVTGHEHQGNVGIVHDADSGESAYVEGCVLQEDGSVKNSSFNVIQIDLAREKFRSTRFLWKGIQYGAAEDGSWSSYQELPTKAQDQFSLQDSFLDYLEDTGAYFWRGTRDISLSDIYVYPDLKPGDIREERQVRISAQKLLQPKSLASGVIISGEEKSGRSSLLHRLYQHYHDRGFLPVLLDARRLRRATAESVDAAVSAAVAEQYGPARVEAFDQQPKSKKLLLVDNFDDSAPISKGGGRALVDAFKARFGQYVITVADGFELRELTATDNEAELRSLEHYQIQPLGYVLRSKLLRNA